MREIFIGDVQGCRQALERLLERVKFDPAADRLRFVGDLVNRGGESLGALRLAWELRDSGLSVLGNHDLHLLAYACKQSLVKRPNPEFEEILAHREGAVMLEWLRRQPVMWCDAPRKLVMVHAGLDPRWNPEIAGHCARELENVLSGPEYIHYFENMYGNRPDRWMPGQPRWERLRAITNVFTRMRFADTKGRLQLTAKGGPDTAPAGFQPWYELLHPAWSGWTIIFGHWSALGLFDNGQVIGLDSACVWGGSLSALVVSDGGREIVQVHCPKL